MHPELPGGVWPSKSLISARYVYGFCFSLNDFNK